MKIFTGKKVLLQHYVLDYKIDLYFPEHRLAIAVDKFDHIDKTGANERVDKIKEKLNCEFIRTDPDGNNYDEYVELCRIKNCIDKSKENLTKKSLIDKI